MFSQARFDLDSSMMTTLCKFLSVIATILLTLHVSIAQVDGDSSFVNTNVRTDRRAKAIYVEVLGSSGLSTSLNYDMRFNRGHQGWGFRMGMALPIQEGRTSTYSFPILFNHVNTNDRVSVEAGIGLIVAYRRRIYDDQNFVLRYSETIAFPATANVGLRFQPLRTGIIWRLYWAPNWEIGSSQRINLRWIGTSLGIGFK